MTSYGNITSVCGESGASLSHLDAFIAQLDRAQASDAWCRGFESPWTHNFG